MSDPRHGVRRRLFTAAFICVQAAICCGGLAAMPWGDEINPKWLDKAVTEETRKNLSALIGHSLPDAPASVRWFGGEAISPSDGQLTIVQTYSATEGRATLINKVRKALPPGVRFVAIHMNQDAEKVAKQFTKKPPPNLVALDVEGAWLKEIGLGDKPINLVVDVNGGVRMIGLRTESLKDALTPLLKEVADPSKKAKPVAKPEAATKPATGAKPPKAPEIGGDGFPVFTEKLAKCADKRGLKMPEFFVAAWITTPAEVAPNKLLVIDFWATWCGPCLKAIPHMNELATTFANDAMIVGMSDENKSAFDAGMTKANLTPESFKYALAIDPESTLKTFFGVTAIPNCAVISSDGLVRWQGHPAGLTREVMQSLVDAQKKLSAKSESKDSTKSKGKKKP